MMLYKRERGKVEHKVEREWKLFFRRCSALFLSKISSFSGLSTKMEFRLPRYCHFSLSTHSPHKPRATSFTHSSNSYNPDTDIATQHILILFDVVSCMISMLVFCSKERTFAELLALLDRSSNSSSRSSRLSADRVGELQRTYREEGAGTRRSTMTGLKQRQRQRQRQRQCAKRSSCQLYRSLLSALCFGLYLLAHNRIRDYHLSDWNKHKNVSHFPLTLFRSPSLPSELLTFALRLPLLLIVLYERSIDQQRLFLSLRQQMRPSCLMNVSKHVQPRSDRLLIPIFRS